MNDFLELLTRKKKKLDTYKPFPLEFIKNLEEWLKVELTYSSNAIEGNTLTRLETAEVIEKGIGAVVSGKPLKDQLEAISHAKALECIRQLSKLRKGHQFIIEQDILDIHKVILTGIQDDWAGKYRITEVFIRGSDAQFPQPHEIPYQMKEFIQLLSSLQEEHPVKIAADAHFKFVSIHPFIDGNGRTTRLLMNLILILNGYPMAVIRNEDRISYLQSFEIARTTRDLQPFYDLIYKAVERSIEMYLAALEGKQSPLKKMGLMKEKALLRIGELAKLTNETVHTLRFWTKEGLLSISDYSPGGYQLYSQDTAKRVQKIRELQNKKRLTIAEIKKALFKV